MRRTKEAQAVSELSKIESVSQNPILIVIARLVMPPVAIAAISVGGWYLAKQNATLERVDLGVTKALQSHELIQQRFEYQVRSRDNQITDINGRLADHEGRIRVLERPVR